MISQTMVAMTQNAPSPTPTLFVSVPATSTPVPATRTPLPTSTAVTYCDWVTFLKDVNIPDGTVMGPGEVFTKTWRLQNRGTCTWTSDYYLVFTGGTQMGDTLAVRLPGTVAPGQTVDVSVPLTAPNSQGRQVGYWMLRNPNGVLFGYGNNAEKAFYVDIKVAKRTPAARRSFRQPVLSQRVQPTHDPLLSKRRNTGERIQFSIPEAQNFYNVLVSQRNSTMPMPGRPATISKVPTPMQTD